MKGSLLLAPVLVGALVGGVGPERDVPPTRSPQMSVEAVLERGDLSTALRLTEVMHRRAVRERRWESLIAVGDAYYRMGGLMETPDAMNARARDAYQAALQSARRAESLDGVLSVAEAFGQLGDVEEVQLSLHIARDLAGSDAEAMDEVRALAGRLRDLVDAPGSAGRGEK